MSRPARRERQHSLPDLSLARGSRWPSPSSIAAWTLCALSVVFVALGLVTARSGGPDDPLEAVVLGLAALSFATVGAILVTRLPRNRIGWLLAAGGLCLALSTGPGGLGDAGLMVHPGSVPGAVWFAWLSQWTWVPAVGSVVGLALVYPSGRVLSARWRPVALAAVVVIAVVTIDATVGPWQSGMFPVQNPLLLGGQAAALVDTISVPGELLAPVVLLLAIVSLVLRYRRVAGIERAQLKWFAFVVAISVPAFAVGTALFGMAGVAGTVAILAYVVAFGGFAFLPVAIGIAVLRYRLYEIDRLISRTVSWGVLTVILGGVFVGLVLGLQALLSPLTHSNELAVAGSTLLVAALFQPLRRRVQGLVDRRFNRSRYDAQQALDAFSARLRDEIDLDTLQESLLTLVEATLEPTTVSLWLRQ